MASLNTSQSHEPWNKGRLIGQKAPLKLKDIWAIRIRLQLSHKVRDLALFNLAIDSKLRACDLVKLRVSDVSHGGQMASRAIHKFDSANSVSACAALAEGSFNPQAIRLSEPV